ncbi:probable ubiquitin-like-specific protease 2B isoform X3 [Trifolium pratense]|uniref:probable ubiquitin-like-specific protease 2B isoform X3 n=1 Tax=Trifolium pratense TaxID=57577 RepID=UPI001E693A87|nr:probable ubiquitin-like-specific protease 2B isoform X3 [Trifolium pratense]
MTQRPPSSSINKFSVYDFDEDDAHQPVKNLHKMNGKFINPKKPRSPISKYAFLQAFAGGSKPESKSIPVDPIELDDDDLEEEAKGLPEKAANKPVEVDDDDDDDAGDDDDDAGDDDQGMNADACSIDSPLHYSAYREMSGYADSADSDFDLKHQSFDMVSDEDDDSSHDSSEVSSSSNSTFNPSKFQGCFEDELVQDDSAAFKIDDIEKVVAVFPDYIQYEELYSTSSRLIFSCGSLRLEGPTNNQTGKTFKIEWETEDIIKIESCWVGKIETALINLFLRSKDSEEVGITNEKPGFKKLKFAVYDLYWPTAEEAIKLLDMRYTDRWSTVFDINTDNYGNNSVIGQGNLLSQRRYFPIFDESFEEVIYPKGEPDAVSISKRDVALLQPETFINDTIIDFYIKYLKNKLPTDEQKRFHFFNSFFFRKLADLDKDPSNANDGRAAFQRVRKWTRKVNLFEKDYILIPINYSLHWSLIVICHPGEVPCFKDEEIKESSKVPCILHLDSLKGSHKGLKNLFQSYLCEEWKERHSNMVDDFSSKFLQLRFISLELPQQENLYDCGLFLLYYVERFLEEAPIKFNPFKTTKFSNFLTGSWFPSAEASLKRSHIQNLIFEIFENSSLRAPSIDCHGKGPLSEVPGVMEHNVEADFSGASCCPATWHGNPSNGSTEIDFHFPIVSPTRVVPYLREPDNVFKDLQVADVSPNFNSRKMLVCHQNGLLSPIEETEEFGDDVERANSQAGILASGLPSTSYIGKDHRASETTQQGFSINFAEPVEGLSHSRTTAISWNKLDSGTLEDQLLEKMEESNIPNKIVVKDSHESNDGNEIHVIQDSQESNDRHEIDTCVKSQTSFQDNINSVTHQILDLADNTSVEDDSLVGKRKSLASESLEQDDKRRTLMNETGGTSRRFTRRMVKETCV